MDQIVHQPLEEVSLPDERFDRSSLDEIRSGITRERRTERLETMDRSMESIRDELDKVANLAQLGLESNQAYFNLTHPGRQKRHKRRMQAIDRLFQGRFRRAARLAQQAAKRAIMRTDLPHDFFALDRRQAEKLANHYYDAIREQARRLLEPLELARERVKTRLLEQHPDTSTEEIISRYLEYREPERAHWLKHRRPENAVLLERAEAAYEERIEKLLEDDRERHRKQRSPRASLRQIERYFSHRNRDALNSLADSLEHHRENDIAAPYAAYARGLQAELEGRLPEGAATHARVLELADLEMDTTLIEHALLRLTHINIEADQRAEAIAPLQAAANINPSHWRMVARLALLQNDAETGISALTRHLEHFPSDVERIKQLVRLFVALELPDGLAHCENYLPFCSLSQQETLSAFLEEARTALDDIG